MNRRGAHVYWTRPGRPDERPFADFEALTLAVSCLMWRAFNGPITLCTDRGGIAHLAQMTLLPFWDEIDTAVLQQVPDDVQADVFWDLGKAVTLAALPSGSCVLDLDLIVWQRLDLAADALGFLHWERPVRPWYLGPRDLNTPPGYTFDPVIDWDAPVCNTAFTTAGDPEFGNRYATEALRFARRNRPDHAGLGEFLFAGQRLFAHLGRRHGARMDPLVEYVFDPEVPDGHGDDPLALHACEAGIPFTHLWRNKWPLLRDIAAADRFRNWLIQRCVGLAPQFEHRRAELEAIRGA